MTTLFISSGNSRNTSPIVNSHGESSWKFGESIDYFTIQGKGTKGYARNTLSSREHLKTQKNNAIHAHFETSDFVATLTGVKPLSLWLMGSDTGRNWDRFNSTVRNKVKSLGQFLISYSSQELLACIESRQFPNRAEMNFLDLCSTGTSWIWRK